MKFTFILHTLILLFLSLLFTQCNEKRREICDEKNYYAGIEISSTSIKRTLLMRGSDGKMTPLTETKSKQLNFLDNNEIDDGEMTLILSELGKDFDNIDRRCIAGERVYIAFSSGLDEIAGINKLKEKIIKKFNLPQSNIEEINYHVETVAAMMTTKHGLNEEELLFIDIGGNNTKIGVYDKNNNLYLSEILNYGTSSLEETIRTDFGRIPSFEELEEKGKELLQKEIDNKLRSNAALNGKSAILFIGGMPYSLVNNIYKNNPQRKLTTINLNGEENDLTSYVDALKNNQLIIPESLKYNPEELYAGYLIMRELYAASEITVAYYIDQISWMSGFVEYKVKEK